MTPFVQPGNVSKLFVKYPKLTKTFLNFVLAATSTAGFNTARRYIVFFVHLVGILEDVVVVCNPFGGQCLCQLSLTDVL
jgi:hypothetical protein